MQKKINLSPNDVVKYLKRANQLERKVLGLYYLENLGVTDISKMLKKETRYISQILDKTMEYLGVQISKSTLRSNKGPRTP